MPWKPWQYVTLKVLTVWSPISNDSVNPWQPSQYRALLRARTRPYQPWYFYALTAIIVLSLDSRDSKKPWIHENVQLWQYEALTTIVVWNINKYGFSPKMRLKSYWLCGFSSTNPREAHVWCPGMCPCYAVPRVCVPVCTLYLDFL